MQIGVLYFHEASALVFRLFLKIQLLQRETGNITKICSKPIKSWVKSYIS
ncbi:Hypothetical protein I595_2654 [Croceitalea dokdonensis DOKDO 023]|uniref:Uncharacterized protein n=1 Tax=Croceitalea dokdonensis DOKDO 023 TaxID=1300341 RepID=A0A0N8H3S5_9FLAO|nr:Hypothetical protein I595_2654 [Croceitalea dokdonensis DOKDO 023]